MINGTHKSYIKLCTSITPFFNQNTLNTLSRTRFSIINFHKNIIRKMVLGEDIFRLLTRILCALNNTIEKWFFLFSDRERTKSYQTKGINKNHKNNPQIDAIYFEQENGTEKLGGGNPHSNFILKLRCSGSHFLFPILFANIQIEKDFLSALLLACLWYCWGLFCILFLCFSMYGFIWNIKKISINR